MVNFKPPEGLIQTSVKLSPEFWKLCKQHNIKFSEALRVGISVILAERGVVDYDNKLTFMRRINKISSLLEEKSQELEEIKEKLPNYKDFTKR